MCSIHSNSISISIYAKTRQVISMDRTKTHTFQSRSMYLSTFTWTFCVRVCVRVCVCARAAVPVLRMCMDPKGLAVSVLRTLHSFARTSDPTDSASSGFYLSLSGE